MNYTIYGYKDDSYYIKINDWFYYVDCFYDYIRDSNVNYFVGELRENFLKDLENKKKVSILNVSRLLREFIIEQLKKEQQ